MYDKKRTAEPTIVASHATSVTSPFLKAGLTKAAVTKSENGALKYKELLKGDGSDPFTTEFGQLGAMKAPRPFADIARSMSIQWALSPIMTVSFLFFIRIITRITVLWDGTKTTCVQRGNGLRHEGIMRMTWLNIYQKDTFWKNVGLYIACGSWKDIITMLSYDLQYNGWKNRALDWDKFGGLILAGLENPNSNQLLKKFLPQVKATSQCKTIEAQADNAIAKWICSLLFGTKAEETGNTYRQYRKLKTSGTAHTWQQLISQGKHSLIDFNTVHGRALSLMVSGKYLANNGLEKGYEEWLSKKPIVKFTGYVHELFMKGIPAKKYQIDTLNSQFKGLVETAKKGAKKATSMIVVRDTSGSMSSPATGTTMSAGDLGKALALFFSEMLPAGKFANAWIDFNAKAEMKTWNGSTACEKWQNDRTSGYCNNTNFQSVFDLLCNIKASGVPENEFPTGIIVISDGELDPASLNRTNVDVARGKLRANGFSKEYCEAFQIVLWNVRSRGSYGFSRGDKFETVKSDVPNTFYFSGFSPEVIVFLTGTEPIEGKEEAPTPKTAEEVMKIALNQELMTLIEI